MPENKPAISKMQNAALRRRRISRVSGVRHGPQFALQPVHALEEFGDAGLRVRQLLHVREIAAALHREEKVFSACRRARNRAPLLQAGGRSCCSAQLCQSARHNNRASSKPAASPGRTAPSSACNASLMCRCARLSCASPLEFRARGQPLLALFRNFRQGLFEQVRDPQARGPLLKVTRIKSRRCANQARYVIPLLI